MLAARPEPRRVRPSTRRGIRQNRPVELIDARSFAVSWINAWNAHDVEAVLEPFADDVVFTSPVAARVLGGTGEVRGKDALRAYWRQALSLVPELHFELVGVYVGVRAVVINYRNHAGRLCSEVLVFDGPRVVSGHGTYLEA
jgi:hypothetical protein